MLAGSTAAGAAGGADAAVETSLPFDDLPGWTHDRHGEALAALARHCDGDAADKARRATWLAALCEHIPADADDVGARAFFEDWFVPVRVGPVRGGFLTGYFEPEVAASRTPSARFRVPLHRPPPELVPVPAGAEGSGMLPQGMAYARRRADGGLEPFFDRREIAAGALDGRGLEIAFLEDPVDAFLVHVQGAARLAFADGTRARIAFAAKSGHPYTPIGRVLVDRGEIAREALTMDTLRDWLAAHPAEAAEVMAQNRSYIFFREIEGAEDAPGPVGAAGVALTPLRSLAVDRDHVPWGTPVWIDAALPWRNPQTAEPFRRLVIAQDTGSAITGPARGDLFFGSGAAAGRLAGGVKHPATFVRLELRADRLAGPGADER